MNSLSLHEFHFGLGASFSEVAEMEVVAHHGDSQAEYRALRESVGIIDLSFRSRICLVGNDRKKFLHGQVTNDVNALKAGEGCYAALITAKGKMQSDLFVYNLENELLLDFEPGLTQAISERLEKYVIADDVQIVDVAPHYGLLTIQGPKAAETIQKLGLSFNIPSNRLQFSSLKDDMLGDLYLMNHPRVGTTGFDLFVPLNSLSAVADKLIAAAKEFGGRAVGWDALEAARIEAGIPRFGQDIDETNLPPEAGIEKSAISYSKGCYIGQEVIARIRTYGQVAKALRGLHLSNDAKLPSKGEKLYRNGKEVGYITSSVMSPALQQKIALGYVRREANTIGTELLVGAADAATQATIVELPFVK